MKKRKQERTWREALAAKAVKVGVTLILFALVKGVNYLFGPIGVILLAVIWLVG